MDNPLVIKEHIDSLIKSPEKVGVFYFQFDNDAPQKILDVYGKVTLEITNDSSIHFQHNGKTMRLFIRSSE